MKLFWIALAFCFAVSGTGCAGARAKAEYQKAKTFELKEQYREAIARYKRIVDKYPKATFKDSAQIAFQTLSSPQFIAGYVSGRVAAGVTGDEALGEFKGLDVIWLARTVKGCVRKDLPGEPVEFKVGDIHFLGLASYSLDRLKFHWFCETNEDQLLTVEGKVSGLPDTTGFSFVLTVEAVARQN